ncbi:MAG TPA: hypothetical protein VGD97_06840 [Lacunisphaera sp.]
MNPAQRKRALESFNGYLHHDWVPLRVAVTCANESVGFDDLLVVTPHVLEFVSALIDEENLSVGCLDEAGKFTQWPGSRAEIKHRVLDAMQEGHIAPECETVWFDRPVEN